MNGNKVISLQNLKQYHENLMKYIDMKIELVTIKKTNCPNCGAPITSMKCEYCGTDFEKGILI